MNESRKIKVVYPNGSFKFVQINSLDIPNNLAQPCDIAKGDVFMIHNGHCLSPYLTIASQNVIDGDVIYLHPKNSNSNNYRHQICRESKKKAATRKISTKINPKARPTHCYLSNVETPETLVLAYRDEQIAREKAQEIFEEILRISDIQFHPYETSPYGGLAYQQLANDAQLLNSIDEENDIELENESENEFSDNFTEAKINISTPPLETISNDPLPVLWPTLNDNDDNLDSNDQTRMNPRPNFHDRSITDTSSSIDH